MGDYRPLPEPPERDEVGQLTRSFNAMTRQLDEARRMVESNRQQLERSNVYLESVLSNLSSGVLAFDESFRVTTVNQGAQTILQADLRSVIGRPLETVGGMLEFANVVRQAFSAHAAVGSERQHWQQQFEITPAASADGDIAPQPLTLLARGTHLRVDGRGNGYLVVFDDITEVISANRTVAWGEVARRLAHEIKNPLTPIQLSAERLAMKLEGKLPPAEAQIVERSTNTIVNQVASLKQMVDDFREYARTPPAVMQRIDFNALVADVLSLYGWDPEGGGAGRFGEKALNLDVTLEAGLPAIERPRSCARSSITCCPTPATPSPSWAGRAGQRDHPAHAQRAAGPRRPAGAALHGGRYRPGLSAAGAAAGLRALRHHQVPRDWVRIGDRAQDR